MKLLFDLFPLILFFAAYKFGMGHQAESLTLVQQYLGGVMADGKLRPDQAPMMIAIVVGIIATLLQIGYLLARRRKVDGMLWVSCAVIVLAGGATIYFHDEDFIKWKPTIIYWIFAAVLFVTQVFFRKNLMRNVLGEAVKLPEPLWPRVGFVWMVFLFLLGVLNLFMAFVVFKNDTSAWVTFKLFGMTGIFFAFVVGQTLLLFKYIPQEEA